MDTSKTSSDGYVADRYQAAYNCTNNGSGSLCNLTFIEGCSVFQFMSQYEVRQRVTENFASHCLMQSALFVYVSHLHDALESVFVLSFIYLQFVVCLTASLPLANKLGYFSF